MSASTLDVIRWAKNEANKNEVVKTFWNELCKAVNQENMAKADAIYSELRLYGSNTALKPTRPEGVAYHEVAKDVADKLAPMFSSSPYGYETIDACERYVLEKMDISEDDIAKICSSATNASELGAGTDAAGKTIGAVVVSALAAQIARMIATRIAANVAGGVIAAILLLATITGPAYRCTIPGVTYVALLRKMYIASRKGI